MGAVRCWGAAIWELIQGKRQKQVPTLQDAQDETEMILFDVVSNLLETTNTNPLEVTLVPPIIT